MNQGDGSFGAAGAVTSFTAGDRPAHSLAAADLDGDGDLDLVTSSTPFSIHLNEGKGSFAKPIRVSVPSLVQSVAALDVDGDGNVDLAAAHGDAGSISILRNEGGATFSRVEKVAIPGQPYVILSGHFNDDGHTDLVAADRFAGKLHLLFNDGSGEFVAGAESRSGGREGFTSLASGDLDADGDFDLAAATSYFGFGNNQSLSVILNNGDETFAEPFDVEVEAGPVAVKAADMDGDGDLDLVSGNHDALSVTIVLNQTPPSPAYLERVCTEAEFHSVSARSRRGGEANRVAKYLAPAMNDPSLLPALFQNVKRYPLHEQFLAEVFADRFPALTPEEYLALAARRETRLYFAGELSLLRTRPAQNGGGDGVNAKETIYGFNVFTDEARRAELLTVEETRRLHETLSASFHLRPLAYAPGSPAAVEAAEKWERPGFPIHFARDSGAAYQPYTRGTNYGRVRVLDPPAFEEANENGRFGWQDILILGLAPSDIEGVVASVITAEPQGELSHLTIRTARRGTPNAFVRGALEAFAALDGKLVRLEVKEAEYAVRDAEPEEAEAWWAANRPRLSAFPALDPEHAELDTLVEMDLSPAPLGPQARFGGKASNFARLQRILNGGFERYREAGFAIPMRHYLEFMRSNLIASSLDPAREVTYEGYLLELFASPRFQSDSGFRFEALAELRNHAVAEGVVDSELLGRLASRIQEVFGDAAGMVRFRSSSNVEDSLEFNGAGLYESASACAADDLDQDQRGPSRCDPRKAKERNIEEALKEVWASLWNFRAHEERAYYQISQASAAMGVLVTRAFLDERANGVAFTGNPSNPRDHRYIVTVQVGEESVVSPEPGVSAEVDALLVEGGVVRRIDRVRRSSLVEDDVPILSDAELGELGALLGYIDSRFPIDLGPHRRDQVFLDFEFKVNPDGALALKQVRPFLASEPEPPGPTFELEVAPGTAACGVFVSGREPDLEYDLKSQVRFRAGRIPLPTRGVAFEAQLFDEVLVGPAAHVAVPKAPGVFSVKRIAAGGGRATYR
ncbi:MAG TPA: FG-GAP-like repeat-containing protein, partial [Planctomycetota bacterium]|nr:FG-GAP-like repeat-containing protein [Planctomycetota bacterium]